MMISPEVYYEYTLKGMTKKQIMTEIRCLKREMGRIKNVIEHPKNGMQYFIEPIRLDYDRNYLELAKSALAESGGTYVLSKAELKAKEFDDNIFDISRIEFLFCDLGNGYNRFIVEIDGDKIKASKESMYEKKTFELVDKNSQIVDKKEFIKIIKELHMGEWRAHYSPERFGLTVFDGIHWEVVVQYWGERKKIKFIGDSAYPYNFMKFARMFGILDW